MKRRNKPRYLQLADHLIDGISTGSYEIGQLLPTERELCIQHDVSRHTARAALAKVAALGLVARRPGAGTRVIASGEPMRYQHEVDSIETLLQYGRMTRLDILDAGKVKAKGEIATLLRIAGNGEVIRLYGLRYGEPRHDPVCTTEIFLSQRNKLPVKQLLDLKTASRTIVEVIDLRRIDHVEQVFDSTLLKASDARLLDTKVGSSALRVVRRYDDADGEPFALAISLHPAGRFSYRMSLTRRRHYGADESDENED